MRRSGLKALHASWVVELYDYLSSAKGQEIIKNGWSAAGVTQAIEGRVSSLSSLDPFQDIDPMESDVSLEEHQQYLGEDRGYSTCFIAENSNEENDTHTTNDIYHMETEEEGKKDENRNIFEILDDGISEDDE